MRIAVEVVYDDETRQWCVGMVAPPWVASCGRTKTQAKEKFLEAFRAYFGAPKKAKVAAKNRKGKIELATVT